MSSFTNKLLRVTLVLPTGTFPGTNSNTLILVGYRIVAKLAGAGNFTNSCDIRIYGMKQADMNAVTVLWGQGGMLSSVATKAILILESNDGSGWLQVFQGQFFDAQPDYKQLPDVNLWAMCLTGYGAQITTSPPSSYSGATQVANIAQQLAGQMGFAFENNGVTGTLHTPYYAGTYWDQFRELARDANFDYYFDAKSKLIICPSNQPRQNQPLAVVLTPTTGLKGYVGLARFGGIEVDCLFTPAIELGAPLQIAESEVPATNGLWFPFKFAYDLDSIKPSGEWFAHLSCLPSPNAVPAGMQ